MVNVPVFAASDVPTSLPTWIETALPPPPVKALSSITAVPETLPKKKTVEPFVVAVLFVTEISPSTPENATKLEPAVSPVLTLPETVAPVELLLVQEKFTSAPPLLVAAEKTLSRI